MCWLQVKTGHPCHGALCPIDYRYWTRCLPPPPPSAMCTMKPTTSHTDSPCTGGWQAPPSPGVCRSLWSGHFPSCSEQLLWRFSVDRSIIVRYLRNTRLLDRCRICTSANVAHVLHDSRSIQYQCKTLGNVTRVSTTSRVRIPGFLY